ncbi:MAG: Dabb family protein [Puniceicoccaceae bacterium]
MKRLLGFITMVLIMSSVVEGQAVTRLLYFSLKHADESMEAKAFFEKITVLKDIPVVKEFELTRVRSKKMEYDYCLRLAFENQAGADTYSNHPIHNQYVKDEWRPNVAQGLLVDHIEIGDD